MKAVKNLGNKLSGNKFSDGLLGASLEDLCRQATNKRLLGPDEHANNLVVEAINSGVGGPNASQQVLHACKKRLTMANPHKQWLAVVLVQKILQDCEEAVEPVRRDIMAEVGKIAAKPMNRYGSDLQSQQQAKSAAFNLLRTYGREGQEVLRGVAGLGSTNFASSAGSGGGVGISPTDPGEQRSWPKLKERVETGIAMATSHNEMLQDMLLNMSAVKDASGGDATFELGFLKDLVAEMLSFRRAFEQLLAQLSTYETEEAQQLMVKALEVTDLMNNTLLLHEEVLVSAVKASKESPKSAGAGASSSTGASPSSSSQHSRFAPRSMPAPAAASGPTSSFAPRSMPVPSGSSVPAASGSASASAVSQPAQVSALDGILELQQALDASLAPPAPPTPVHDPFAASSATSFGQQPAGTPASAAYRGGGFGQAYAPSPALSNLGQQGSPAGSLPSPGLATPQPTGQPRLLEGGAFDLHSLPPGKPTPIPMATNRSSNNPFAAPPPSPATPYGVSPMQLSSMREPSSNQPSSPSYGNSSQLRPASYPAAVPSTKSVPPPFKLDSFAVGSAGSSPNPSPFGAAQPQQGQSQHLAQVGGINFQHNPVHQHTPQAQHAQQAPRSPGSEAMAPISAAFAAQQAQASPQQAGKASNARPALATPQPSGQEDDAEWDMFFKDRVASPTSATTQQHAQHDTGDAFDELLFKR